VRNSNLDFDEDDATNRLYARFVRHDSTAENMRVLQGYLERFGRLVGFCTQTRRDCFRQQSRPGAESNAWTKTRRKCRRPRLPGIKRTAHCLDTGSGYRLIPRKPRQGSNVIPDRTRSIS